MSTIHKQLLTHSRIQSFKTCRRKHKFQYELGIRPVTDAKALRMGSAYHNGLEALGRGGSVDDAVQAVLECYSWTPDHIDNHDWEIEQETVVRLICGYAWRWADDGYTYIETEGTWKIPLVNPETGAPTTIFDLSGKIDGIVRLQDGRLAVKESKLLSEELTEDSDLWRRLRLDSQISMYVLAARARGHDVCTVLYDVTRKPTIKPTNIPLLDGDGIKIVLDSAGNRVTNKNGSWRQTASTEDGYVLQSRPMTADEWGDKLNDDIGARPELYYARREIVRLDKDLEEFSRETWDIQKAIRDAQLNDRHYRTVSKDTCTWCAYFGVCEVGFNSSIPEGFVQLTNLHPELSNGNREQTTTAATTEKTVGDAAADGSYW